MKIYYVKEIMIMAASLEAAHKISNKLQYNGV